MGGFRTVLAGAAVSLALACQPAAAKSDKATAAKPSPGAAYIEQLGAPADWKSNARFWAGLATTIPATAISSPSLKLVIADPGNTSKQVQSGAGQKEFILQWGAGNSAQQSLSGSGDRAEVVQISPGAALVGKANAGAGNGGEFDLFGFEIDPGNSGAHNHSPEAGGMGSAPGVGNRAVQQAAGTYNVERTVQIGWGNVAEQAQAGSANQSVIVQIGTDNRAASTQEGARESSVIVQQGSGNTATVVQ